MSQTLRRSGPTARRTAAVQGKAIKQGAARARNRSLFDRAIGLIPLSEAGLHRLFLAVILGGAASLAWAVASLAGVPAMAQAQVAALAGQAGFEVKRVEVRGVKHLNELKVYESVLSQRNRAMPLVDLQAVRAQLLALSWVADARVSRQLPDALVVDIVERSPHAVLRVHEDGGDRLVLIDSEGHALEPISAARVHGRLVLSGEGAAGQVAALSILLDAAPALRPQVAEAQWIGNRRWNLIFRTGQILALPEGDHESADALVAFARMDGTNRLLGGRASAIDMRAGDRIYFRVPHRDGALAGSPGAAGSAATEQP